MNWIVEIVKFKLAAFLKGKIFLWSGTLENIPAGFALCNGDNGTPDLRSKFVPAAGGAYAPGDFSGIFMHNHTVLAWGLGHTFGPNNIIQPGLGFDDNTNFHNLSGSTYPALHRPPYYALAFVMKF